jgi:hypothetical protein
MIRALAALGWGALIACLPAPAAAQSLLDQCAAQTCKATLTADQLLGEAQALIAAKRFDEARPMLAALEQAPQLRFETRYLNGVLAAATGDHASAAEHYRAILSDDPGQTRVRLDLAREMLALGQTASADRQFKMAQADRELPPEVARTIRTVRDIIRAQRAWRVDLDFGIAPDTNINNATGAETVDIIWGAGTLPLTLDEQARAQSGTGQTATISAGLRLPLSEKIGMLLDLDTSGTNYAGQTFDDYQVQLGAGPQLRISDSASLSLQGVGARRWYGGTAASNQYGLKLGAQATLGDANRIGLQLDARQTDALFDDAYDGVQVAAYASFEHALSPGIVASAGAFGRRDWLSAKAYSNAEFGAMLGVGGELPAGFNFGVSGTASRAIYDAPMPLFSLDPRKDLRLTARATIGNRKFRFLGFSPQVTLSYGRTNSSITYYSTDRTRLKFSVARYF